MIALADDWYGYISYTLGCFSVLIWMGAQLPQVLKNWRKRSVEGLSPSFLAAWVAGDASNLGGCILTGQLGVQTLLASYFCIIDLILITQYVLYSRKSSDIYVVHGYDPYADDGSDDNTNHFINKSRKSSMMGSLYVKIGSIMTTTSMAGSASAAPIPAAAKATNSSQSSSLIRTLPLFIALKDNNWTMFIGYLVAYFSMCMYLTSRIPQIYHNYQRKSTTGISMLLFIFALMGNLTYVFSIVLSPQCLGSNADTLSFLKKEFSYIMGASGTVLFDCIILFQWHWYQRVYPRRRRSTAPLDRIQRPYLGTPRNSVTISCRTPLIQPHEPQAGSPPLFSLLNEPTSNSGYGSVNESAVI